MKPFRAALSSLFCVLASLAHAQIQTVTFQQGVNGYTNCKAAVISDLYFSPQLGTFGDNGTTYADGDNDHVIGRLHGHPSFGYDCAGLLRFENLGISNGSPILAATLTVWLSGSDPGAKIVGRYLNQSWFGDATSVITGAPVGWRFRDRNFNLQWAALGALGEGTDLVTNKQFLLPESGTLPGDSVMHSYVTALDVTEVQKWINSPSANFGVRLQVDILNVAATWVQPQRVVSAQRPVTMRPQLTVTFGRPTLQISRTNNLLRLAWPTNAGSFILQQANFGSFTNSSLPTTTEGSNKVAYDSPDAVGKFYRLLWLP
jgi:hypothetical protein